MGIKSWNQQMFEAQWKYIQRLKTLPDDSWVIQSCQWVPPQVTDRQAQKMPHRKSGHPQLRWDDHINGFCRFHANCTWQSMPDAQFNNSMIGYMDYCGTQVT